MLAAEPNPHLFKRQEPRPVAASKASRQAMVGLWSNGTEPATDGSSTASVTSPSPWQFALIALVIWPVRHNHALICGVEPSKGLVCDRNEHCNQKPRHGGSVARHRNCSQAGALADAGVEIGRG